MYGCNGTLILHDPLHPYSKLIILLYYLIDAGLQQADLEVRSVQLQVFLNSYKAESIVKRH